MDDILAQILYFWEKIVRQGKSNCWAQIYGVGRKLLPIPCHNATKALPLLYALCNDQILTN